MSDSPQNKGVSESRFYMWRALFAVAHADHVITDEEARFMAETLEEIDFSPEQEAMLVKDINKAQDIEEMFSLVTDKQDKADFFNIARQLSHIDGDYGQEEQDLLTRLMHKHVGSTDIDSLIGEVGLSFEDDYVKGKPNRAELPEDKPSRFQALLKKITG